RAVPGRGRTDRRAREALRRRYRVGVERRLPHRAAARPEAATAHLVRVCLARDVIGAWPLRRAPPREAGHRQVEAAPEELHRAAFADEAAPEFLEHSVGLRQDAPTALGVLGVIG